MCATPLLLPARLMFTLHHTEHLPLLPTSGSCSRWPVQSMPVAALSTCVYVGMGPCAQSVLVQHAHLYHLSSSVPESVCLLMIVVLLQAQLTAKTALCAQTQARLNSEAKQHGEAVHQLQQQSQGVMGGHSEEVARLQGLLAVAAQHKCHTAQVRLPCLLCIACIITKLGCAGVCEKLLALTRSTTYVCGGK